MKGALALLLAPAATLAAVQPALAEPQQAAVLVSAAGLPPAFSRLSFFSSFAGCSNHGMALIAHNPVWPFTPLWPTRPYAGAATLGAMGGGLIPPWLDLKLTYPLSETQTFTILKGGGFVAYKQRF